MCLINLLMELSADIGEEKFNELYQKLENLNNDVRLWSEHQGIASTKIDSEVFHKLILIERELKEIYAKCGYRSKTQDDATKALR